VLCIMVLTSDWIIVVIPRCDYYDAGTIWCWKLFWYRAMNERVSEPASDFGIFMGEYQARIMGHAKMWNYSPPCYGM
jgi:hypothetical protein